MIWSLYVVLNKLVDCDSALKALIDMLTDALKILNNIENKSIHQLEDITSTEREEKYNKIMSTHGVSNRAMAELMESGAYFPHFPVLRKVPNVMINGKEATCTKNYRQPGTMAPGIVFYTCLEHGKNIGFNVLKTAESPVNIISEILARFPEPVKAILYDNGCHLAEAALNRSVIFLRYLITIDVILFIFLFL